MRAAVLLAAALRPVAAAAPAPACKDIVALAQSVPDLSTLVQAVVAGGLVDTLKGPGPFTVFAPTNEAFAALPPGTLEKLLKPENKAQLDDILTYHVLAAKVLSSDLKDGETAETVEGNNVTVHISSGAVKINDATVQQADVLACNGVVHVIDAVLLPPTPAPPAPPTHTCGSACNDGIHDCDNTTECSLCVPVTNTTFKCAAGCGKMCTTDEHCGTSGCGNCVGGKCAPHALVGCGGSCADGTHDCDPSSDCKDCVPKGNGTDFHCAVACGNGCSSDDECGSYLCGKCINSTCTAQPAPPPPPGPPLPVSACLGPCADGQHNCDPTGECSLCTGVNGSNTSFFCAAGCGGTCADDSHCATVGCGYCVAGKCAPRKIAACGGSCNDGISICDNTTECNLCTPTGDNVTFGCSAGCGSSCTDASQCSTPGCGSCTNGTCSVA